ncbi:hypothetical protein [Sporosarcina sp. FSL W7-1283]|uniref:hypothetical protein n=1 Tax=Sporosarcina sp. FSL W7-1283 TaxID=2921560 RepID=UPI0030F8DF7F
MDKTNQTAEELAFEITYSLGYLGCLLEDLEHARNVLGRMALDAKDKYAGDKQMYFLWDNNDALQTVDNLMFRLLKEVNHEYKKIDEMQTLLGDLIKVGELNEKKSVIVAKNDESEQIKKA